jgi:hypothetical protein
MASQQPPVKPLGRVDIGFATGLFAVDHMRYSSLHLISTVTRA